ncbi:Raffinose synthase [Cynara cardunculus var. scolymus]|uniref:Raffinose synthase n=1 Tax=Cynara cardunculus var. scolymus TaxID=59895 RepID=A0A103YCT8_CYNCS|nr:Raffinose synthase [Cynara cardunculus var. scolymus]
MVARMSRTKDVFYTEVTSEGVKLGFESSKKGGISLIFLIIDDVWQIVGMDPSSVEAKADNSAKEQGGAKMEERSSPTTSNQRPSLASSELKMSTTCLELQILLEMEMLLYIVILAWMSWRSTVPNVDCSASKPTCKVTLVTGVVKFGSRVTFIAIKPACQAATRDVVGY